MNIGFIGTGKMATALIKGILTQKVLSNKDIFVYDVVDEIQNECVKIYNVNSCASLDDLISKVNIVILATKPNVFHKLLPSINQAVSEYKPLIISIAAGKTLEEIEDLLGFVTPIVRIMPNINATISCSMSAFCCNELVMDEQKAVVIECFSSIGKIIELEESMFSIFCALSASSPAFVFLFIDSLARAALKLGMNKNMALEIAAASVVGSAKMILESKNHPWELIDAVCSPGGTTIQGLSILLENGFDSTIIKAIEAAAEKDKKI